MISLWKDHQGDLASRSTGRNFLKKEVDPRETDFYSQGSPSRKCLEEKITIYVDGTATKRQNHLMKVATQKNHLS